MRRWLLFLGLLLLVVSVHAAELQQSGRVTPRSDVTVSSTATQVLAASQGRIVASCTNTSSADHVRWGDSSVTAAKGQRLPAGASIEIFTTAAVYMIAEGSDVGISCTEETP